ncbi:GDP-mannose 4,6-dehydratase [Thermophilibacter sp.]
MSGGNSVLIFGVSGFVGGYLTRELKTHGYKVFGSDRGGSSSDTSLDAYCGCDVTDSAGVARVVEELTPSVIVNLAAVSSVGQSWRMPQATVSVNVNGALNILEAAKAMERPPKVLLVGSSEEYAPSTKPLKETDPLDATNPYGISKIAQERFAEIYCERYGLKVYLTRSFNHTGVGQTASFVLPSWCKQAADIQRVGRPGFMRVGNLDVSRDFSDVRDIVRGYRMLVESDHYGQAYNFGSGEKHCLKELLDYVTALGNGNIEIQSDENLLRPSDNPVVWADCSKVERDIGWRVRYPIEETIQSIFNSYLNQSLV